MTQRSMLVRVMFVVALIALGFVADHGPRQGTPGAGAVAAPAVASSSESSAMASVASGASAEATAKVTARMTKLPLRFEANAGQWDEHVRFVARQGGATLFLTDEGMTLGLRDVKRPELSPGAKPEEERAAREKAQAEAKTASVTMKLVGAKKSAPRGEEELITKSNFFLGNDKSKWRTNVPNYAQVRASGGVLGVDIVWHGGDGGLEYDLQVAKGVDARKLELAVDGATKLEIAEDGSLDVVTPAGTLVQKPPRVLQAGRELPTRYELSGKGRVRFEIEGYDARLAVLIDPALAYSTYLGGTGDDFGQGIAVDGSGNAYVTGYTGSTNFPTQSPLQAANAGGADDVFVSKLNAAGSALLYSTYLGGTGNDQSLGIAVDGSGNAYVTGGTSSTNFPTQSPLQAANAGAGFDVFVSKLNAAGSALLYSTYLGGTGSDNGSGIAVDGSGNAYVTGSTISTNFPTQSPLQANHASDGGSSDVFVSKLNATGSALLYSTYLGGAGADQSAGIAVDGSGNAYVTGVTTSTTFPTQSPLQAASGGGNDVFVSKLNAAGSALLYSTYLGGTGQDVGSGIAVDGSNNAYVTGSTQSANFPTQSPLQAANAGAAGTDDAFVSKLNAAGSALLYSTYLGGNNNDQGHGIAADGSGNAYVTGYTGSMTNFPTQSPLQAANAGGIDVFVSKLNAAGSALLYSTYLGGTGHDEGHSLAVDGSGNAYVTGLTTSTNFSTQSPLQAANAGAAGTYDVFVSKIALERGAVCTASAQCVSQSCADGVCCDTACNGGCDRCDLPGTVGTCTLAAAGNPGANPVCTLGYACDGLSAACPTSCTTDAECATTDYCAANGTCQARKAQASACNTAAGADCKAAGCHECTSGFCSDGFCCDTACNGACTACSAALKGAGTDGTCGNAAAGTNAHPGCTPDPGFPANCKSDGKCDGLGACRTDALNTVACDVTSCNGNSVTGKLCDGIGNCLTSGPVDCAPYACIAGTCKAACVGDGDCAASAYCTAAKICAPKKAAGTACARNPECTGVGAACVDGLCCNSSCQGQCEACDVGGHEGSCLPVTGAPHGSARAACAGGTATCGGTCNGANPAACGYPGATTTCGTSCTDGKETTSSCDSAGACVAGDAKACAAAGFTCDGMIKCRTSCAADTDCATGFTCAGGTCIPKAGATCDGDHTTTGADGTKHDCAPFKCQGNGTCQQACTSVMDCVAPTICDPTGKCSPPAADTGSNGGCAVAASARGARDTSAPSFALLCTIAALARRRRRSAGSDAARSAAP